MAVQAEDSLAIEHLKNHYDSMRTPISLASEETIQKITSPDRVKIAKESIQAWGNLIPDVTSRVRTQKSIFIRHPCGHIPGIKNDFDLDNSHVLEVPKNLKESILSYLHQYQIIYSTLFSDFWGCLATQDDVIKWSDGGIKTISL